MRTGGQDAVGRVEVVMAGTFEEALKKAMEKRQQDQKKK